MSVEPVLRTQCSPSASIRSTPTAPYACPPRTPTAPSASRTPPDSPNVHTRREAKLPSSCGSQNGGSAGEAVTRETWASRTLRLPLGNVVPGQKCTSCSFRHCPPRDPGPLAPTLPDLRPLCAKRYTRQKARRSFACTVTRHTGSMDRTREAAIYAARSLPTATNAHCRRYRREEGSWY